MGRLFRSLLTQEWRRGEMLLLAFALMIAVGAMACVDFLAQRLNGALEKEAHQFLAGDVLLSSDHPWPDQFTDRARQMGLQMAQSQVFLSVVRNGHGLTQLAQIKAADAPYPLRGALRSQPTEASRTAGLAWIDQVLANRLQVQVNDEILLGDKSLRVAAILLADPERPAGFSGLMPKLLMNLQDVAATGLIQPGSRLHYRLHLAGSDATIADFTAWASSRLSRGERIESLAESRDDVRQTLDQGQRYLHLTALLSAILAAVVCALCCRSYVLRSSLSSAILRCLGARPGEMLRAHLLLFATVGAVASIVGVAAGYVVQTFLSRYFVGLTTVSLPAADWLDLLTGGRSILLGVLLVMAFATPPLVRLSRVPVIGVLRPALTNVRQALLDFVPGIVLVLVMILSLAGDWKLGGLIAIGLAVFLLLVGMVAWMALRISAASTPHGLVHMSLRNLLRRPNALVQVTALTLGLTSLLLLNIVRGDFINSWLSSLPPQTPNHFALNIQPQERDQLATFFRNQGLNVPEFQPMVRGRLTAINGKEVRAEDYPDQRAQRLVEREFNLSWRDTVPPGNRVVSGAWFTDGRAQFSVESGLAKRLHLQVGDQLTFSVLGAEYQGAITNLRKLDWNSMKVNFFVILPPGVLPENEASYLTSFYLPPDNSRFANNLIAQFPHLTLIDVRQILDQIQTMLRQLSTVVQGLLYFALLAGLAVVFAGLSSQSHIRSHEIALWRVLGDVRRRIQQRLTTEFLLLGALAGLLAALSSAVMAMLLGHHVFNLPYTPGLRLLWGPAIGIILCVLSGLFSSRTQLRETPLEILGR